MDNPVPVDIEIAEAVLSTLSNAYPRLFQPEQGTRDIYISRLLGLNSTFLLETVERWIDENRFPPSAADLRRPTLVLMKRQELLIWLEESQVARPRLTSIPGSQETVASGMRVADVLTEIKRSFSHTFFSQVVLVEFDPEQRKIRLSHPRPLAIDWWRQDRLRTQILDTLCAFAAEPIAVEFVSAA